MDALGHLLSFGHCDLLSLDRDIACRESVDADDAADDGGGEDDPVDRPEHLLFPLLPGPEIEQRPGRVEYGDTGVT